MRYPPPPSPQDIARILGLRRKPAYSLLDLSRDIANGFPASSVAAVSRVMALEATFAERHVISRSALVRRREAGKPLSSAQGECLFRLAEVWIRAKKVYRDSARARDHLHRPQPLLQGRSFLALAAESSAGMRYVVRAIDRQDSATPVVSAR